MISSVKEILDRKDKPEVRALFAFNKSTPEEKVLLKLNLWGRYFYPKFYKAKDAPFHKQIDTYNLRVYRGQKVGLLLKILKFFVDIAFRGAAKTTRTKLCIAFCISNDEDHYRRYIKVLSADGANSKQIVTDIYNMLMNRAVNFFYPEIFQKTIEKRSETMSVFTTSTGIKMQADSVGTDQRGDIQEDARPDLIWFDDFETRKTLRSAITTQAIWDNMEEAKNGLSKDGACLYNCNYLSERGNVHKLVEKYKNSDEGTVLITPIKGRVEHNVHFDGPPTWPGAYTPAEVESKIKNADDPAGEYLCVPSAGADIYFDRKTIDKQEKKDVVDEIAGFKIFHKYDPSHRYGSGHDVAKGVKLDSSASVFIDFSTIPFKVVATYANNEIEPRQFAHEIHMEAKYFGKPIVAVENNKFEDCIGKLRDIYDNLYFTEEKETRVGSLPKTRYYGWNTNTSTKSKMLGDLKQAVKDGQLELSDPDLIAELRSYTRDDLMDRDDDVRLTTRHFDLLIACAIAFQMKDHAEVYRPEISSYQQPDWQPPTDEE